MRRDFFFTFHSRSESILAICCQIREWHSKKDIKTLWLFRWMETRLPSSTFLPLRTLHYTWNGSISQVTLSNLAGKIHFTFKSETRVGGRESTLQSATHTLFQPALFAIHLLFWIVLYWLEGCLISTQLCPPGLCLSSLPGPN